MRILERSRWTAGNAALVVSAILFATGCGGSTPLQPYSTSDAPSDPDETSDTTTLIELEPGERCTSYPPGAIASFADANLEAGVRAGLSLTDEPITCDALRGLTDLHVGGAYREVRSLLGIQNATELTRLVVRQSLVVDISPLGGLTSLRHLELWQNSITDIGPLAALTGLTHLNVTSNRITDLSPLGRLVLLDTLKVSGNPVTDLSVLDSIDSLTELAVGGDTITDLSAVSRHSDLTRLSVGHAFVRDIDFVGGLTELTSLGLSTNEITDISPLGSLTKVETVFLGDNTDLVDVQVLFGLPNLVYVNLTHTEVSCADIWALRNAGVVVVDFVTGPDGYADDRCGLASPAS